MVGSFVLNVFNRLRLDLGPSSSFCSRFNKSTSHSHQISVYEKYCVRELLWYLAISFSSKWIEIVLQFLAPEEFKLTYSLSTQRIPCYFSRLVVQKYNIAISRLVPESHLLGALIVFTQRYWLYRPLPALYKPPLPRALLLTKFTSRHLISPLSRF